MRIASPREVTERYARVCEEVGPAVTVVVATKYVSVEELGALAEAGVAVVGENRAQDLEQKYASVAPLRTAVEAGDVAETVAWLLEGARRLTGDIIYVDAGMHIASPRR